MSKGAQPSPTVHNMLVSAGILKGKKINILPAYKAPEAPVAEEAPAAAAPETAPSETPAEAPVEAPAPETKPSETPEETPAQ
jgi:hypothetical protein